MCRRGNTVGDADQAYSHIAMRDIRRLDLLWSGEEIADYDTLLKEAGKVKEEVPEYVKNVLRNHFNKKTR
jgi:hypothetical protein